MNRREFLMGTAVVAAAGAADAIMSPTNPNTPNTQTPKHPFSLTVLNPDCMVGGAGQCCILRMPSGKVYLYDTGNGDYKGEKTKNNGKDLIAPWLKSHGIKKIDGIVISHYHADHFGGFLWLRDNFEIGKVFNNNYAPPLENERIEDVPEYAVARRAITEWGNAHPGCLVEDTKFGDELGWDEPGVRVEVVWPPKEGYVKPIANRGAYLKKDNHFHHLLNGNSTALRITADGKSFFIVGDIQADYLETYMRPYLQEKGLWGGDFVVLPAHGTKPYDEATTMADMSPAPKAVVASLGNLPWMIASGKEAVHVFTDRGTASYSTNVHGDITATVEDGRLVVTTDIEQRYPHDPK